ncbi:MAG TPA: peptidoglycan DD-metalloendopeptidase family protein [Firmicutes bacterium]|nr:peptidoglycan DD-metalloendopeptidase family protein [Candidatus Fermentithermobacillaceae bacterium]
MEQEDIASRRSRRKALAEQAGVARMAWVTVCCLTLFACGVYMGLLSVKEPAPPVLIPDYTIPAGTDGTSDPVLSPTDLSPTVPAGASYEEDPGQGTPKGNEDEEATETLAIVADLNDLAWPCFGQITREPGWYYSQDLGEWHYLSGVQITGDSRREVRAALPGTVKSIDTDPLWGKVIVLDHGSGILTEYGGIDIPALREGDQVAQGQTIARLLGETLTFRITKNGDAENPADYLTQAR